VERQERLIDGVFQGGGAKGAAYVGALEVLESRGYWFRRVAGTSSGSLVAALIACGYRALPTGSCSLRTIVTLEYSIFQDGGWFGCPYRLLKRGGLFLGDRLTDALDGLLKKGLGLPLDGPSPTFADLTTIDLHIIASSLTSREVLIFNRQTTPDLAIAHAVRMSSSLPLFYVPYRWSPSPFYSKLLCTVRPQVIVDGGVLSSFPMFIFKEPPPYLSAQSEEDRARPKIGFALVQDEEPGVDWAERLERKRRARPSSPWWRKTLLRLGIGVLIVAYFFFLYYQVVEFTLRGPLFAEERLYEPLGTALAWLPEIFRRLIYLLLSILLSLPRLLVVFLPIIIALLTLSMPWRLFWQMTGLATVAFDKKHIRSQDVLQIFVGPYASWRFRLSDDQREDLVERGEDAVLRFLPEWEARYGLTSAGVTEHRSHDVSDAGSTVTNESRPGAGNQT
jgi:predicted acylesterase/phospholipase RssA